MTETDRQTGRLDLTNNVVEHLCNSCGQKPKQMKQIKNTFNSCLKDVRMFRLVTGNYKCAIKFVLTNVLDI